eukprot:SAG31_NODE_44662_length_262_cov_0.588957_1_plen_71_part_01
MASHEPAKLAVPMVFHSWLSVDADPLFPIRARSAQAGHISVAQSRRHAMLALLHHQSPSVSFGDEDLELPL